MKTPVYQRKAVVVFTHVAVWAVALSLPYLLDTHHGIPNHPDTQGREKDFLYFNFITNLLWVFPFYLNAYWLTPRLFYTKRYFSFIAALLLMFGVLFLIHFGLHQVVFRLPHFTGRNAFAFILPTYLLTIAIGTTYRMVKDKIKADLRVQEQQKENLKTELSFLRSQINPHFIFNILNNLVALEQMKSPDLGPTILKLSSLLQYMLYDTDEERVALTKEADYLQSYIDLQRQRFGQKVPVAIWLDVPDGYLEIEPMLLIPFIENAFKHGVGMIDEPEISIKLDVKDGVLSFSVRNRFNPSADEIKDKTAGIGLGNVRRRLELLYGKQQNLLIDAADGWFSVSLQLNLH